MSLLKINIEKPALVEERVYPDRDSAPATASTKSESSCSSLSSVLKPLLGLLFVVGAALFVAKRRSGTGDEDDEDDEISADDFSSEPAGSGNLTRKLGLLASLLGVVLVARKRRGGNDDE